VSSDSQRGNDYLPVEDFIALCQPMSPGPAVGALAASSVVRCSSRKGSIPKAVRRAAGPRKSHRTIVRTKVAVAGKRQVLGGRVHRRTPPRSPTAAHPSIA
jgi:hypothetical protein